MGIGCWVFGVGAPGFLKPNTQHPIPNTRMLLGDVVQQGHVAGALDGFRQGPLVAGAGAAGAARQHFAPLGNELAQLAR